MTSDAQRTKIPVVRRLAALAAATAVGVLAAAPATALRSATVLHLHLVGFGAPAPTTIDSGSCPQGRTSIPIESTTRRRIGTARVCVLTLKKTDAPDYGVRQIVQAVSETDSLPGGTIVSRQTQTIRFARDQRHTTAIFSGRVISGTGRYAHAHGTISGGGPGFNGKADWLITLRLR
jgi:hypothetical protein